MDDHRSGKIVVELIGRINKCGVISPRFDVAVSVRFRHWTLCHLPVFSLMNVLQDVEQWVLNVLPSRGFGHIVLTTTYGILDHEEARRRKTGGKILGFFY